MRGAEEEGAPERWMGKEVAWGASARICRVGSAQATLEGSRICEFLCPIARHGTWEQDANV